MEQATIGYGPDASQFGVLSLPDDPAARLPIVGLVHGGFWRAQYGLDLMDGLAIDLVGRGFAVWNIEYRRMGQAGGGWPGTLVDVATAIDELADLATRSASRHRSRGGRRPFGGRPPRALVRRSRRAAHGRARRIATGGATARGRPGVGG